MAHAYGVNRSVGLVIVAETLPRGRRFAVFLLFLFCTYMAYPIVLAVFAELEFALWAFGETGRAERVAAVLTCCRAIGATMLVALGAADHAIVADIAFTSFAGAPIILVHQTAAIAAVGTMPVFETDVGAARVVGAEDLSNEQKEIQQSSLAECRANCCSPLSFTELSCLDMGMRYIDVGRGWVRIDGRNLIGLMFVQAAQVEDDLEAPEFDSFQRHLLRDNGNRGLLEIAFDFTELVLQRGEVTKDFAWQGRRDLGLTIRERARKFVQPSVQVGQVLMERLAKAPGGEYPIVLLCLLDTACQSFAFVPEAVGQRELHRYAARLHEGFVDCSGGTGRFSGLVGHGGSPRDEQETRQGRPAGGPPLARGHVMQPTLLRSW